PVRRAYLQQVVHDTLNNLRAKLSLGWVVALMVCACFAPLLASSHPYLIKAGGKWYSPMLVHLSAADVALPVAFVTGAVLVLTRRVTFGRGLGLIFWATALVWLVGAWGAVEQALREAGMSQDAKGAVIDEGLWAGFLKTWTASKFMFTLTLLALGLIVAYVVMAPIRLLPARATVITACCLAPLLVLLIVFPLRPPENVRYEQYREWEAAGKVESVWRAPIPFSPTDRLNDRPQDRLKPPGGAHWAGTDDFNHDLLSRMIHGCRIALAIGFVAVSIEVILGVFVGGLMGYFAGTIDLLAMRLIEILEAVPRLVLLITVTAAYGRNLYAMMAIIGLLGWTGNARFVRAEFLKLRKLDFVQAAQAAGLPLRSVLFRHMLPNGITPVLVTASFGVAAAILIESTLSFLGLGLVDEPSWGGMLAQATRGGAGFNWWIATFPGLLIFLTVFAYNLIGESVRDALDPKLLKRE
ncbi:MAG TPA: ABC transporter permease, partial [Tepidisphaeraceae bacterium]|nr:ABC transporter permease [Tepidisphaeraceae bacterium]